MLPFGRSSTGSGAVDNAPIKAKNIANDPGDTSCEEDDDQGFNPEEFFEPEVKVEPLKASDGKFIFLRTSVFMKYWQYFVIVLAIYNSITIPISIFYDIHGHSAFRG